MKKKTSIICILIAISVLLFSTSKVIAFEGVFGGFILGLLFGEDGKVVKETSPNVIYLDKDWASNAKLKDVLHLVSIRIDSVSVPLGLGGGRNEPETLGERIQSHSTIKKFTKKEMKFFPVSIIREGEHIYVFGYVSSP